MSFILVSPQSGQIWAETDCSIDLSLNNVLMRIKDESILPKFAQEEIEQPFARMIRQDRTIYISRLMPISPSQPVLCDFGEARVGSLRHTGEIMPRIMRAPEVILGIDWKCKVDVWALGVMVSVLSHQISTYTLPICSWIRYELYRLDFAELIIYRHSIFSKVITYSPPRRTASSMTNSTLRRWCLS